MSTNVYIVQYCYAYEGGTIHGVFTDYNRAVEVAQKLIGNDTYNYDWTEVMVWQVDTEGEEYVVWRSDKQ